MKYHSHTFHYGVISFGFSLRKRLQLIQLGPRPLLEMEGKRTVIPYYTLMFAPSFWIMNRTK